MNTQQIASIFRLHGDQKQRLLVKKLKAGGERSLEPLIEICAGDFSPSIKRWAVEALGNFRAPRAIKILRSALKSPHMSIRLHALVGLAHSGHPKAIQYIRPMLSDESGGIRINALEIIAQHKPRWWKAETKKLTRDPKWYIQGRAKKLLED